MRHWTIKNKKIKVSGDQVHYLSYHQLQGFLWKGKDLYIPLTMDNITIILKQNPHNEKSDTYLPAFVQACIDLIDKSKTDKGKLKHLKSITFDIIDSYLPLVKHKSPKPFKNQKIGLQWLKKFNEHGQLWDMGTGKTRTAIEGFILKKSRGDITHCLVVCPVSMLDKWVDEIDKWSDYYGVALKGTRKQKIELLEEEWDFYIINFESLISLEQELLLKIDSSWLIIADETTKIKNPYANRSKALHKLGGLTDHKVILTGTPITQHGFDIFSQFLFLDNGKTFGLNYDNFINRYYWKQGYNLKAKPGALEGISNLIQDKTTRFRKSECIDIPEKMYDIRKIQLSDYTREVYEQMVKWCITQIENQSEKSGEVRAPVILTQLLRLSQITSGFVKDEFGKIVDFEEQPKLDALQDIFESGNGNKFLVWARFQYDVEKIMELCKTLNINSVDLYGETNKNIRTSNIHAFQYDPHCKVLVGTAGTGGLGIELTAADTIIYYSNSYSLEHRLQSEDRVHRAGLDHKVLYIDLLADKTIDIAIYQILRQKKAIADIITKDNLLSAAGGIA